MSFEKKVVNFEIKQNIRRMVTFSGIGGGGRGQHILSRNVLGALRGSSDLSYELSARGGVGLRLTNRFTGRSA